VAPDGENELDALLKLHPQFVGNGKSCSQKPVSSVGEPAFIFMFLELS
jgi:hypothetical protein